MAELHVLSGALAGERIELGDELVLGRSEQGPGNLGSDEELSRRHARIRQTEDGRILLQDLGSTNGTRVNGQPILGVEELRDGDMIEVGSTTLQLLPRAQESRAPRAAPLPLAIPPAPPPVRPRRWPLVAALAAILLAAGLTAALVLVFRGSKTKTETPAIASDCGAKLGGGRRVAFVAYVESNVAKPNANTVIAMPYRAGDLKPLAPSQCPTGGSGSADLSDSGVLDADNQVALNPERTLLFAVNQGSDSIAVFHVEKKGGLKPVDGSPFPSGGKAPTSLGIAGHILVVANKADDGVRYLTSTIPNYTTFRIAGDGRLTRIEGSNVVAKASSLPTNAYVAPGTTVVFSTEESGPLRGFRIGSDGVLEQAPGSPLAPDRRIFGPGFEPLKKFGLGIAGLSGRMIVYIGMPTVPAIAVYSYDQAGSLRFLTSVPVRGGYLPCWVTVAPGDRWLYVADAATNNIIAFDLSNPELPRQMQTLTFVQPGNPWNLATDPDGRYLFVNAPRDTLGVPEGTGNIQHVLSIGANGKLKELRTSPATIPVGIDVNPQGLAVLPLQEQPVQ